MTRTVFPALVSAVVVAALSATSVAAQSVIVSGRVTSGGAPLVGAHVKVDELTPKIDRVTNGQGHYTFVVPSSSVRGQSVTIVVTMVDRRVRYAPKSASIALTGGTITKDFDLERIEGTPVPTPGAQAPTQAVGASRPDSTVIDSTRYFEIAGAADLASVLAGRVPGLEVVPPSTPGGSASLVFRGPRSILGPSQPAIIVDGVVINTTVYASPAQRFGVGGFDYGSGLADLDVATIASVKFLSGPEAQALVGGRGANGAVVIRTKSGSDGPAFGVLGSYQSVSESVARLPNYQNQYGQGLNGQFQFFNGKGGGINDNVDQSWGPALDGRAISQASYTEAGRPDVRLWSARPDNVRNYFAEGRTSNVMAAVQGHSDIGSFRISGGARDTRGVSPGDELTRRNIGVHGTVRPFDRLRVEASGFATEWKNTDSPGTGFNEGNPFSQFTRMGRQVDTDSLQRHLRDASGRQISWNYTSHNNPYFATLADSNFARRYHVVGGGSLSYAIKPWLTASARGGADYFREHRLFYVASGWVGGFPSYAGPGDFSKGGAEGNEVFVQQTTTALRLDGVRSLKSGARWTFAVGTDLFGSRERIRTLGVDSARHVPSAGAPDTAKLPALSTWAAHSRETSAIGETGVVLPNGASLRVGVRNQWTTSLPGQHSSTLLPSVTGSVDLMRAFPSMAKCCMLSGATLRGSWWRDAGQLSPYVTETMYAGRRAVGNVAPIGDALLVADTSLAPELTTGWQIGGDATLRPKRMTVGVTIYSERTSGVILPVANTTLGTLVSRNLAEVSNRGIEGLFTSRLGDGDLGLQWDLSVTAGKNSNQVVALNGQATAIPLGPSQWGMSVEARSGLPLGALMGRRQLRDAATGAPLLRNGLPLPDSVAGPVALGSSQPSGTLGLQSSIRFRWLTASIAGDGRFGGSVYSGTNLWGSYAGTLQSTAFRPDSGLLIAGIDAATGRANTTHVSTQNYYHALSTIQEPWVYSASYFKIRDARLTLTLPTHYVGVPFQSASLSLIGRNIYRWSKAPNIDPEAIFSPYQLRGIEMGQLPTTSSVGVQVTIAP